MLGKCVLIEEMTAFPLCIFSVWILLLEERIVYRGSSERLPR